MTIRNFFVMEMWFFISFYNPTYSITKISSWYLKRRLIFPMGKYKSIIIAFCQCSCSGNLKHSVSEPAIVAKIFKSNCHLKIAYLALCIVDAYVYAHQMMPAELA